MRIQHKRGYETMAVRIDSDLDVTLIQVKKANVRAYRTTHHKHAPLRKYRTGR